ncbi:MAG: J domain-containing protein [Eikenella sp.]|nr:J domain-containing protein [Eikenella sp.]
MPQLPTHYRTLNIPENAGTAEIRAAYRRLSQPHHPDRNPDDAEALRIMQLVNEAYRVLSDPELRRRHDRWIAEQRRPAPPSTLLRQTGQRTRHRQNRRTQRLILGLGLLLGLLGLQLLWWHNASLVRHPAPTVYQRPTAAPNGRPWPLYADYIDGYPRLARNGTAIASFSNPGEDRLAELQLQQNKRWQTIRTFYLPRHGHFTVYQLGPGRYRLRHSGLDSGRLLQTEAWQLEKTGEPPIYSDVTVTLPQDSPP